MVTHKKGVAHLYNADGTPIKIKKGQVKPPSKEETEERTHYCTSCGKGYPKLKGFFRVSGSPFFKALGYIPICSRCIDHYEKEYTQQLGSNDEAIRRLALHLDLYLDEGLLAASRKVNAAHSRIAGYISKANLQQYRGKTYDAYLDEVADRIAIMSPSDGEGEADEPKISQETLDFWGLGFSRGDYVFLDSKYNDWTSRHECETKVQESVFQKICLLELQILKTIQKGEKTDGLMRSFNDLLGTANIKPVQNKDNYLAEQNTLGTLIQKWENEHPIPDDPEFEDVDGIRKYIQTWMLGHLCKMLNIKNGYSELYTKEIGKYTVDKPVYEEDVELTFDEIFERVGDGSPGDDNG